MKEVKLLQELPLIIQTKVKNIVLMAARILNPRDLVYHGFVGLPLEYAKQVLDKNHNGSFSLQEASQIKFSKVWLVVISA